MGYQPKGRTHPRHRDREANACEARKEDVTGILPGGEHCAQVLLGLGNVAS